MAISICEKCGNKFDKKGINSKTIAGVGAGGVAGGLFGSTLGIAGAFGAISGTLPLMLIGGVAGGALLSVLGKKSICPECRNVK